MSSIRHSTPRSNVANTPVMYFNGLDTTIPESANKAFIACLYSSSTATGASIENVEHEIPYNAIIRDGEIDIESNGTSSDVDLIIALDGEVPPPSVTNRCIIRIPNGQIGMFTSGNTFTRIPKGAKVSWEISPIIGGTLKILSHLSITVNGSSSTSA